MSSENCPTGSLYIVATPIGNLGDITLRAIDILKKVDFVAAEDTRHSRKLLNHLGINTALLALHEHNERERSVQLLERVVQGESAALISDAGTPLISDPGYTLVNTARNMGVNVVPIPGACALVAALSVCGLPSDRFFFEGFLPAKQTPRLKRLELLRDLDSTLIFYESPHRIEVCVEDLISIFGEDRKVSLARELTKTFETIKTASLGELKQWIAADHNQTKGEMVVLVEGVARTLDHNIVDARKLLEQLLPLLPLKKAAAVAAAQYGASKNELYDYGVSLKNDG
ncbi:SAM-dependent 16S rRNA C1402 2'-O-ribose methyltransferase [Oleiphilus messinensis]|uniref:Ribosomal RNA small subunit methyltransferase I n=1 Tax=Oleiphilus messinensis TaxID=141451 RepID=A0A1Y0IDV8_9GAMM|nr:16S rRNA (cytidine(1402)-2'-O)-methyltransferase [Oleiphilus messinensis]ARU58702.1 SAM-dependent 16S rRNA C1402 2'-O-ribose methyltransferase [Oleiphilus messinensis]